MYTVLATVVAQIYAIDLHRKDQPDRSCKEDLIQRECKKRTFWAAFTLDKYTALCLGRPQFFHDNQIDQVSVLFFFYHAL